MKISDLRIGMKVVHPHYGEGEVKKLDDNLAQIQFIDGLKPIDPPTAGLKQKAAEAVLEINGQQLELAEFIESIAQRAAQWAAAAVGAANDESGELAKRWQSGQMVLKPSDSGLQAKEIPLERFFHKIVMLRDNLRVLEQKINSHPKLEDIEKVELQQYITRCYGSLTTFNIFFKDKDGQFRGASAD
jgi:hypothetical protein